MSTAQDIARQIPFGRLAFVGTVASLATCYLKILLLVFLWFGSASIPEINPHVQAAIMTLFALLAMVGLSLDRRQHRSNLPLIVGIVGVALIVGTLYISYKQEIEFTGYLVLIVAVFLNQNMQLSKLHQRVTAMNAELAERTREAERVTSAKSRFLANMSHELRTPLNAIIGLSEMLHEDAVADGNKEQIKAHERIVRAGRHLLGLIHDVLDLSKIEAGRIELRMQSMDVAQLLSDVELTVRPLAEKNGNALEVGCDAETGSFMADPLRIRQALLNLASNACKFTERGRVSIKAVRDQSADGQCVRFIVRDTGIGIPPENLNSVFEEFSQVQHADGNFGGTGLGLTISRQLCRLMGGDISVQSTPGAGSTFTIRLPASAEESAPIPDERLPTAASKVQE